jgi:hypothetical protein
MIDKQAIGRRWDADGSKRDERGRRLFAASETRAAGWGGLVAVSEISGLVNAGAKMHRPAGVKVRHG